MQFASINSATALRIRPRNLDVIFFVEGLVDSKEAPSMAGELAVMRTMFELPPSRFSTLLQKFLVATFLISWHPSTSRLSSFSTFSTDSSLHIGQDLESTP
jgi:hypothetical protein